MSLAYPIAKTARAALKTELFASSRGEAGRIARTDISGLETEWLAPPEKEIAKLLAAATAQEAAGFVQHYEDANGKAVIAITYWKVSVRGIKKPKPAPKAPRPKEDHTDDLYFRRARTPRKPKPVDPNQLVLFDLPNDEGGGT